MRLYALDCGQIVLRDLAVLYPGVGEGVEQPMSNSCFLVDHPEGLLLWDTGVSDAVGAGGIDVLGGAFHLSAPRPMLAQLEEIGVRPADVDYLALSHFHDDHTGNANAFAAARLIVQRPELDAAFGPAPASFGFYAHESYAELDPDGALVLDGQHDVFGDGRVVIMPAPGHTPGHQMLLVDLERHGPVLIAGDLYHIARARAEALVPGFNHDHEESVASMQAAERLVQERGAELWIQHDPMQDAQRRHAPEFYD